MRPFLYFLGHEGPFQARGETGAATAAQARLLHDVDNGLRPQRQDGLGIVPLAALPRAFQTRVLETVKIGENTVAIGKHQVAAPGGFWTGASRSDAPSVGFLASASVTAGSGTCL